MSDVASSASAPHGGHRIRVVLDAMGGDLAPNNEVAGALLALSSNKLGSNVELILVGREEEITPLLQRSPYANSVRVVHASDVVGMGDEPSSIIKNRRESSLYMGLDLMRSKNAEAFVSTGNTGGVMATATLLCGRIPGVSRPTIGSFFPTKSGRPTLLLDVGANVGSKPKFLSDYAIMGSVYARLMLDIEQPTVGLLNVGEEEGKGTEVTREAYVLLANNGVNFHGNVEGRDILAGTVDIVVCDGFEGNIVLKFAESILGFLKDRFRSYAERGIIQKIIIGAFRPVLKSALRDMDYQEYGGVPLLGINGVAIIGHGSSSPLAVANMIQRAVEMVRKDVNGSIQQALLSSIAPSKEIQ